MIIYIPSSVAELLSAALWNLASPPGQRTMNATSLMFDWEDDLQGQRWLKVHDDFSIFIHPDAELGAITAILQPWIDVGHLPADTNAQLTALIESKRDQRLVAYDAFPALFKLADANNPTGLGRTLEQMIEEARLTPITL